MRTTQWTRSRTSSYCSLSHRLFCSACTESRPRIFYMENTALGIAASRCKQTNGGIPPKVAVRSIGFLNENPNRKGTKAAQTCTAKQMACPHMTHRTHLLSKLWVAFTVLRLRIKMRAVVEGFRVQIWRRQTMAAKQHVHWSQRPPISSHPFKTRERGRSPRAVVSTH